MSVRIKAKLERTNSAKSSITILKRKTSLSLSVKDEIETVSLIKRISKNSRSKNLVKSFVQSKECLASLDVTFIKNVVYNLLSKQKNVKLFVIFLENIDDQMKNTNTFTDFKINFSAKFHDMIDVFFKLASNKLTSHRKHDHKIVLKKSKAKT